MSGKPSTNEELAQEVKLWESEKLDPKDWDDAPSRVPRAVESEAISLRMPTK